MRRQPGMKPKKSLQERFHDVGGRILKSALSQAGTRCMACGRALQGRLTDACCSECAPALRPRSGGHCPLCGEPYVSPEAPVSLCGPCRRKGKPWSGFGMFSVYGGALRDALIAFKFHADFGYLRLLQLCILQAQRAHGTGSACSVVAPVPLHVRKLRQRGFNQSLELCRPLSSRMNAILAPRALSRVRDTRSQSGLDRRERRRNMRGSVAADPALVESRRVLLVDDVYTTGITAEVCVRALLLAGAERVDLLVLARAPGT